MSISKSGGTETHIFQIQIKESLCPTADYLDRIGQELGLQGRAAIDGKVLHFMLNARSVEMDQLLEKLLSTLECQTSGSVISRERLPYIHLSGFKVVRGSSTFPMRERHVTDGENMCMDCRAELKDPESRRFGYPFTECPICAPTFHHRNHQSTVEALNRLTCIPCREEAADPSNRRYHFGEISCPDCGPAISWQRKDEARWQLPYREALGHITTLIREGGIVAIKGNGGYHLVCDATNEKSIRNLRKRKGNLLKPMAVMYPGLSEAAMVMEINEQHAAALLSATGSIVVCPFRLPDDSSRIARTSLTGILDRQAIMLPHSPLMQVISSVFDGPLAVTSANMAGEPIIHRAEARSALWMLADAIIDHDRQINTPREEPVIQFTDAGDRILMRSGNHEIAGVLSDGHHACHAIALTISQGTPLNAGFIQDGLFRRLKNPTVADVKHIRNNSHQDLSKNRPEMIITERVPKHLSTSYFTFLRHWPEVPILNTWHHEAHFASVLAEHGLMTSEAPILGVVWDRGGLGEDGQQWGSECIIRKDGRMQHLLAFDDLPFADQDMSKTGHRIAALGLLRHRLDARRLIGHLFSREEWPRYERWAMRGGDARTSSMIHFIDGVAAILGLTSEGYEGGEMNGLPLIETIARKIQMDVSQPYELQIRHGKVDWRTMIDTIIGDMDSGAGREMIARRFLASLASLIAQVAYESGVKKVALSGDVFTSPLLVSMISEELGSDISLYIHQSLAPTDECINLGQLALWLDAKRRGPLSGKEQRSSVSDKSGQSE
jgi:hydrogenase maturation protein HypF